MNQRSRRLRDWFLQPPLVVSLVLVAGGTTLLAEGLKNWRTYAVRRESSESLSPIAVRGRFASWAPVATAHGLTRRWYLIVRGFETVDDACRRLTRSWLQWNGIGSIGILNLGAAGSPVTEGRCTVAGQPVPILLSAPEAISSSASSLLPTGFVLTDAEFFVVYGSGSLRDLERIPRIISLLGESRGGA
jgi:hypothetical protein